MARKQRNDTEIRKQNSIKYPRKCDICDYISNNPSMFHYHKRTHISPDGKLCDHGCNRPAIFTNTKGTNTCCENSFHCPKYLELHSERIKSHWDRPEAVQRREDTAKSVVERLCNKETVDKSKLTKITKTGLLTEEKRKFFRRYAYSCRKLAQLWASDNRYEIGKQTFHVDHIYSVLDGFNNEVAPSVMSHPANLRILDAKLNAGKGPKSEITLEELLLRTNQHV